MDNYQLYNLPNDTTYDDHEMTDGTRKESSQGENRSLSVLFNSVSLTNLFQCHCSLSFPKGISRSQGSSGVVKAKAFVRITHSSNVPNAGFSWDI
jgi:hypothetical protein